MTSFLSKFRTKSLSTKDCFTSTASLCFRSCSVYHLLSSIESKSSTSPHSSTLRFNVVLSNTFFSSHTFLQQRVCSSTVVIFPIRNMSQPDQNIPPNHSDNNQSFSFPPLYDVPSSPGMFIQCLTSQPLMKPSHRYSYAAPFPSLIPSDGHIPINLVMNNHSTYRSVLSHLS